MALTHDYHCRCGICTDGRSTVAIAIPADVRHRRHYNLLTGSWLMEQIRADIERQMRRDWLKRFGARPNWLAELWLAFEAENPELASDVRLGVACLIWFAFAIGVGLAINGATGGALVR